MNLNVKRNKKEKKNTEDFRRRFINAVALLLNREPYDSRYYKDFPQDPGNEEEAVEELYMIDFRPGKMMNRHSSFIHIAEDSEDGESNSKSTDEVKKIPVKPIDVLNELTRTPTKWSLEGLDDKIGMMESKLTLIKQRQTKLEAETLLSLLKNRKKYFDKAKDGEEFWKYFAQYDTTNDENIKKLIDKYTLVMQPADIFIPEFPEVASKIMIEYSEKCNELTGKKPLFFVIATEDSFKENYAKRDPILLVQSPFGFYYHILGAWDKEMLYLPEL